MRSFLVLRYVLGEMIPSFFMGVVVFLFILLMFQALRLTEYVLVHGVKVSTVAELVGYLSTSFLPILFPMSLLFTVLLTYGRLSNDSEIIAMKASGLSMWHIIMPALLLSSAIGILSAQFAFHVAPWGNRQFELTVTKISAMKPSVTFKEGTFSEGFFDLVVYANKVDNKAGLLSDVFIYDERDAKSPLTVIAHRGRIKLDPDKPGHSAALLLTDGSIHRTSEGRHTKIDFNTYTLYFSDPVGNEFRGKSPQSLNWTDITESLGSDKTTPEDRLTNKIELHKRVAISFACVLFGLIGVGLGTITDRRSARSGGMVVCLGLVVCYWILYVIGENLARDKGVPPLLSMWIANLVFTIAAVWSLRRAWR